MALDLSTQIMDTLPVFIEGRDRQFHFESDGTLVYEQEEGDWEPPQPIDGFEMDPDNPWRLRPLWGRCGARLHTAIRFPTCGCIGLISRCTAPDARFMQRITYEICQQCLYQNMNTNRRY